MRTFCTFFIILITVVTAYARPVEIISDTLQDSNQFSYQQLIVPTILVTAGWFGTGENHAIKINNNIRNQFSQWRGDCYFHADDYLQYLPVLSFLGLEVLNVSSNQDFTERLITLGTSYVATGIFVNVIKHTVREKRPDSSARNSFPSGHTATAFMGAELIRREYGLGYGIAAYAVATGVGVLRIYNDRHWLGDVITGAGIGILGAEIGYWLLPYVRELLGIKKRNNTVVMVPTYTYARGICIGQLALHIPFG